MGYILPMSRKTSLDIFLMTNGITTSEIARLTGLSRKHAITLRRGRGNPTERTMQRIAMAAAKKLQRAVSVAEVFGFTESAPAAITRAKRKASS
jgi:transcriptional regulator with XRE-family HTH domain